MLICIINGCKRLSNKLEKNSPQEAACLREAQHYDVAELLHHIFDGDAFDGVIAFSDFAVEEVFNAKGDSSDRRELRSSSSREETLFRVDNDKADSQAWYFNYGADPQPCCPSEYKDCSVLCVEISYPYLEHGGSFFNQAINVSMLSNVSETATVRAISNPFFYIILKNNNFFIIIIVQKKNKKNNNCFCFDPPIQVSGFQTICFQLYGIVLFRRVDSHYLVMLRQKTSAGFVLVDDLKIPNKIKVIGMRRRSLILFARAATHTRFVYCLC